VGAIKAIGNSGHIVYSSSFVDIAKIDGK